MEFLRNRLKVFYITNNVHIVWYCECVIVYRFIKLIGFHGMLHQVCTKIHTHIFRQIGICLNRWNECLVKNFKKTQKPIRFLGFLFPLFPLLNFTALVSIQTRLVSLRKILNESEWNWVPSVTQINKCVPLLFKNRMIYLLS